MASNFVPTLFGRVNSKIAVLPFRERSLKLVNYFMASPSVALTELTLNDEAYPISPAPSLLELPHRAQAAPPGNHAAIRLTPSAPKASHEPASQNPPGRALAAPSMWERIRKLSSRWWLGKMAASSAPILLVVAILAVIARRNRA